MKILCIYPNAEGYGRVPLGFSLIITSLLNAGHEVALFDTTFMGSGSVDNTIRDAARLTSPTDLSHLYDRMRKSEIDDALESLVNSFSPDLVAITITEDNYKYGDHLLDIVHSTRITPVIVGGITPSLIPEVIIENPNIDYICQGEGEEAIIEFCTFPKLIAQGRAVHVENIRSKNWNNPLRPHIDMATLPIQNLNIWDSRHFVKPYDGRLYTAGLFEMSRGCLGKCSYCVNARLQTIERDCGPYHRERPIAKVIEEVKVQKDKYSFDLISFTDDNFPMMSSERMDEFVRSWKAEIALPFWIPAHVESITEKGLAKLKDAGCCGIGVGIESGSRWLREYILSRRDISNDYITKKCRMIQKSGIRLTTYSMIGFPHELEDHILETIELNRRIKPTSIDLNFVTPYSGTFIHALAHSLGFLDTYTVPGFRGMAKDITMRKHPVMTMPQITSIRLVEIFYNFTDYVYGNKEFK